jgi:hypothetical protein
MSGPAVNLINPLTPWTTGMGWGSAGLVPTATAIVTIWMLRNLWVNRLPNGSPVGRSTQFGPAGVIAENLPSRR